jgi:leucyl-tRNA synthetase
MGHVRNYTLGDVVARYKRARGFNWCCTRWAGTPSACRRRTPRSEKKRASRRSGPTTNIATMRAELKRMGLSLDWDARDSRPAIPDYYRHQQKLFLDFWTRPGWSSASESCRSTGTRST